MFRLPHSDCVPGIHGFVSGWRVFASVLLGVFTHKGEQSWPATAATKLSQWQGCSAPTCHRIKPCQPSTPICKHFRFVRTPASKPIQRVPSELPRIKAHGPQVAEPRAGNMLTYPAILSGIGSEAVYTESTQHLRLDDSGQIQGPGCN